MSFFSEGLFHNRVAPRVRNPISLGRFAQRLGALAKSLTQRKQVLALNRLDDRMLADIGVTRADVEAASRWSLWGDPGGRLAEAAAERVAARERTAAVLEPRRAA